MRCKIGAVSALCHPCAGRALVAPNKHWGAPLVDSVDSGVDSVGRRVDSVDSVDSGRRLGEW